MSNIGDISAKLLEFWGGLTSGNVLTAAGVDRKPTFQAGGPPNAGLGALIAVTSNPSIPNNSTTVLTFDATAVFDDAGFFNSGAPDRLTVPAGITRIIIACFTSWASSVGAGERTLETRKNFGAVPGNIQAKIPGVAGGTEIVTGAAISSVVAGDFFQVRVTQNSGAAVTLGLAEFGIMAYR